MVNVLITYSLILALTYIDSLKVLMRYTMQYNNFLNKPYYWPA